jgi:CheY-like chemotaxis protein
MPHGGRLLVETAEVEQPPGRAAGVPGPGPGAYLRLRVSDTGTGMEEEIRGRLFEPFFTSKEPGKRAGLGLATAYAAVRQWGGHVAVESEPGQGAAIEIYLPRIDPAVGGGGRPEGGETVLLAEDEATVRGLLRTVLAAQGYTVLDAPTAAAALAAAAGHRGPIHLLVTDVNLPGAGGPALAAQLRAGHPETRVIFVSGESEETVRRRGPLLPGSAFLPKPFGPAALVATVREVLDRPGPPGDPTARSR